MLTIMFVLILTLIFSQSEEEHNIYISQVPEGLLPESLPAKQNSYMGNQNLLIIKLVLEEWKHWLEVAEQPFLIWMDHKNLEYICGAKFNSRQMRWAFFFTPFSFNLSYCPVTRNRKPDALSLQYRGWKPHLRVWRLFCSGTAWSVESHVMSRGRSLTHLRRFRFPTRPRFIPCPLQSRVLQWGCRPQPLHQLRISEVCQPSLRTSSSVLGWSEGLAIYVGSAMAINPTAVHQCLLWAMRVHTTFHIYRIKPVNKSIRTRSPTGVCSQLHLLVLFSKLGK